MSVSSCRSVWLYADHTTGHGPSGEGSRCLLWGFFSGRDTSNGKSPTGARLLQGPAALKSLVCDSFKGTAKPPFPLPNLLGASWFFPVNGLGLQSFCPAVAAGSQSDGGSFCFPR